VLVVVVLVGEFEEEVGELWRHAVYFVLHDNMSCCLLPVSEAGETSINRENDLAQLHK